MEVHLLIEAHLYITKHLSTGMKSPILVISKAICLNFPRVLAQVMTGLLMGLTSDVATSQKVN